MITNKFIELLLKGDVDITTAQPKVLLMNSTQPVTVNSTSISGILSTRKGIVEDTALPYVGVDADLSVNMSGVKLIVNPSLIKLDNPKWVTGILVYLSGAYGSYTDVPVMYIGVPADFYYNIAVLSSGTNILTVSNSGV